MRVEPGQVWSCGKTISTITKVDFGVATMVDDDGQEYQLDCRVLLDEHMFGARIGNGWRMIRPAEKSS